MANTCPICHKKVSAADLTVIFPDMDQICKSCFEKTRLWRLAAENEGYADYFAYKNVALAKLGSSAFVDVITERIDAIRADYDERTAETEQQQRKSGALRAAAAAEMRTQFADEDNRLDQSRTESVSERIAALRTQGYEGYWEYYALSLADENGAVNPNTLTLRMNELGLLGWRLRCAYANELGHNTSSVGLFGVSTGTNVTVDQNILIFERFVRI